MSWFDEQLKNRKKRDEIGFRDSLSNIKNSIIGKSLSSALSDNETTNLAIGKILKYYHFNIDEDIEIPKKLNNPEDTINYICRPYGINHREVILENKWYKYAYGPMLGTLKDGQAVALIPDKVHGYSYHNIKTGEKVKINRKTVKLLSEEATYFYCPFPLRKLKIIDLIKFMLKQITVADIIVMFLMLAITSVVGLLGPVLTKWLFGYVLDQKNIVLLFSLATFMIMFSLTNLLIGCFKSFVDSRIQTKIDAAVESAVMQRILSSPPTFFKNYASGELSVYVQQLIMFCKNTIVSTGIALITSLFSLMYLGQVSAFAPSLVVPSLIFTLINIVFSLVVSLVGAQISKKQMGLSAKESGMCYSMISGIQKIKLAGAEKRMFARWGKLYAKKAKFTYNPPLFIKLSTPITYLINSVGVIIMYYIAVASKISISDYYAFTASFATVSSALSTLVGIASTLGSVRPVYKAIKPILDIVPEANESKLCIDSLRGGVELNNVSFRYSEDMPLVIDNLSFKINSGDYVAIVGKTGCGKSTLVRLLLGFEKPQKGAVYYDKRDIETIDLQSLRQSVGTVMQNTKLFNADIYSNIIISAPWVDEEGAWKAAEIASIDDDIRKMPMGMHTIISEGGGGISGGQRQRLAIARAVVANPRILIFDEATSALDNITQKKVSDAIDSLKCTRIIIAHRLSTIKNCNRIIVLDSGHIIEDGTYDELIKKNGFFAELVKRQRLDIDAE